MNEDPILFAAKDRVSYFCAAASGLILMLATTTSRFRVEGIL